MIRPAAAILAVLFLLTLPPAVFAEGTVKSVSEYEFWEKDKVRKREVYDLSGKIRIRYYFRLDGSLEKMDRYGQYENKLEEAFYDEKGRLRTGVDGWAAMRWFYDEESRLRSQVSYDEEGKPLQRLAFSESGKLINKQYRSDIDINPYEYLNSMAVIARNRESMRNQE